MAKNRELSQLGALVVVDDSNRNIGIATTATPSVGIGTTNPAYKLDVEGDINSRTEVRVAGVGVATGVFIQNNGTPAGIVTTLNFNNNVTPTVGGGVAVINASVSGGGGGASLDDVTALAIALG